jgi:tRNA threonylcarbamoyladenosine biosynthesis protein TsaB
MNRATHLATGICDQFGRGKTILAIETSTERCSVALMHQGAVLECAVDGAKRHAESVLVFVDQLLAQAGLAKSALDAVAFGRGPGAFTGVRLAVAVAQGFAYALDIPALPVSTLAATALDAFNAAPQLQKAPLRVALDARMGEIYSGRYQFVDGFVQALGEEQLLKPGGDDASADKIVGSGALAYPQFYAERTAGLTAQPCARHIVHLAQRVSAVVAHAALPVYLREHVALSIRERMAAGMPVQQAL